MGEMTLYYSTKRKIAEEAHYWADSLKELEEKIKKLELIEVTKWE